MADCRAISDPNLRLPRYTSYPTAPHFGPAVGAGTYARWLGELPPRSRISLYLHIPYCDTLCWFCACRTQGTRKRDRVEHYLRYLDCEIEMVAAELPPDARICRVHLGGGSPSILSPAEFARLGTRLRTALRIDPDAEIAVEIDPRDIDEDKLDALAAFGLTRASIGVQDFAGDVQQAINRLQGFDLTRRVIEGLRARGVRSLNIDAIYGLPRQTVPSIAETARGLVALAPDRVALFGYAHVPWMARRQQLIREEELPGPEERLEQAAEARAVIEGAGYRPIGIDHFARPGDGLVWAAGAGRLRRNFQGYTDDDSDALIGLGASAISHLPQGYAQNAARTADYQMRVQEGGLATERGHAFTLDDRVRAAAIERLMCDLRHREEPLRQRFGDAAGRLGAAARSLLAAHPEGLDGTPADFRVRPTHLHLARVAAAAFDAYLGTSDARHSLAV